MEVARLARVLALSTVSVCTGSGLGQTTVDPEALAPSTRSSGAQDSPDVCVAADGGFVVVWESAFQDGDGEGVFARRYDADAAPLAVEELQVPELTAGDQRRPAVCCAADGGFVVVWQGAGADGDADGVAARVFLPSGVPLGEELVVNATRAGDQELPDVACAADGSFTAVWQERAPEGGGRVLARRFDATGAPLTDEVEVVDEPVAAQLTPAVAPLPDGESVVVWVGGDGASESLFAHRMSALGEPLEAQPFRVNIDGDPAAPAVASAATGAFVVAWASAAGGASGFDAFARRFDANATPLDTLDVRVNATAVGDQVLPAVAATAAGDFVVTWAGPDPVEGMDVFARSFFADGLPRDGADLLVSFAAPAGQFADRNAVAAAPEGNAVVVWERIDPAAGTDEDVVGRRLLDPLDLAVAGTTAETVPAGAPFVTTLTVTNAGPPRAAGVGLDFTLPDGASFVAAAPSAGSCTEAGGLVTCSLTGLSPDGAWTVDVTADAPGEPGTSVGVASVAATQVDTDPEDDAVEVPVTVVRLADLGVTKAGPATAEVGERIAYTIEVTNVGPSTATAVSAVDVLPDELAYVSGIAPGGSVSVLGQQITAVWNAVATDVTVTFTLEADVLEPGALTNTVTVSALEEDPDPSDDAASADTLATLPATIGVEASCRVGCPDAVLVVRITGDNTHPEPATVTTELVAPIVRRLRTDTVPAGPFTLVREIVFPAGTPPPSACPTTLTLTATLASAAGSTVAGSADVEAIGIDD